MVLIVFAELASGPANFQLCPLDCRAASLLFYFILLWGKGGECVMHRSGVRRSAWGSSQQPGDVTAALLFVHSTAFHRVLFVCLFVCSFVCPVSV